MHPVLFNIGGFEVRTYGVALMIGVVFAVWLSSRRAASRGIQKSQLYDSIFWIVVPGILGARLTYIALNWDYYAQNTEALWSFRFQGLTSYGGILMGLFGLLAYCKIKKVPVWRMLDVVAVPALLAHAIGRVGCLFNGCCHGPPGTEWYCVVQDTVRFGGLTFVPAQLVDTLGAVIFAMLIWSVERRLKVGQAIALMLGAYGFSRIIFEIFRADIQLPDGSFTTSMLGDTGVSKAQAMGALLMIVAAVIFMMRRGADQAILAEQPEGAAPAGEPEPA